MQPSSTDKAQISFLLPDLESRLDPRNALFRLAWAMDWSLFEKEFRPLYCTEGRPALPIRRLVGLLMLKRLSNLSDEEVVVFWSENPYAQDFCGERELQWGLPCDASELTHFRKRIGTGGAEKILAATIQLHGERAKEKEVVVDTTVQEKNITFPTDTKLAAKIVRGGSENGTAPWGEIEAKFRAHGVEVAGGAARASDQRRSGASTQGGSAFEDDRRAGGEATGCRSSPGKPGPALGGNCQENPEPKALRQRENLLPARTGGLLRVQGQGAQKV